MKVCTKCGGEPKPRAEFYKNTGKRDGLQSECKTCTKAAAAKRYADDPGRVIARVARRRTDHPEKIRESNAKHYADHSEKYKADAAKYRAANSAACRINEQNRRARKRATNGKLSKDIAEKLFTLQRGKCACCRTPLGDNYHRDHHMPLALGGTNTDDNIQLLCPTCNLQKSAKHPIDFMQQRGFLL